MSKLCNFFATKNDLIPRIKDVETSIDVHYFLCGQFDTKKVIEYASLLNIRDIGISTLGKAILSDMYLVLPKRKNVKLQKVYLKKGGVQYAIDQGANPKSIIICIGGIFKNQCLISSSIGTIGTLKISNDLFQKYSKLLTKGFTKVKSYYVGQEAMQMLEAGYRLITIGIDSPKEYDLAL
ncbi:MAG: hypothetical protein ABIK92_11765 [Pseudomonadota bacterium]